MDDYKHYPKTQQAQRQTEQATEAKLSRQKFIFVIITAEHNLNTMETLSLPYPLTWEDKVKVSDPVQVQQKEPSASFFHLISFYFTVNGLAL